MREPKVTHDYVLFQFCRAFHKLPHEIEEMPLSTYQRFCGYMTAEGEADKIRKNREKLEALSKAANR
jgi:hypothetical protein